MTVAVGVDVGNSTTEAVLAEVGAGVRVLAADRVPTRGVKGSAGSLAAAAALVRRLERTAGRRAELVLAAPLRPVHTATAVLPDEEPDTGRLRLVAAGAPTAAGDAAAVGPPAAIDAVPAGGPPAVALVPAGMRFDAAAGLLRPLLAAGRVAAVVVEGDEGVLVANRLPAGVPVVDQVPLHRLAGAALLAVECRPPGRPLRRLVDPLWLLSQLELAEAERGDAVAVARSLYDAGNGVVARYTAPSPRAPAPAARATVTGVGETAFGPAYELIRGSPPGRVTAYRLPDGRGGPVDDLYAVDLGELADAAGARRGTLAGRSTALAALSGEPPLDPAPALAAALGVEARTVRSEAMAARAGALATPGAGPDTVVVDLGGGTLDVVWPDDGVVAAGCGELLTAATAALLGVTRAAAEWVKRGPCARLEGPQLLAGEDGSRTFLDRPAPGDAVGQLAVPGPAGLLPFGRGQAPSEWRALRLRLKADVLGGNLARALRAAPAYGSSVVVVGGPAGDEEVLAAVARALPPDTAVSRGDVAGLGYRYAVAYGLLRCAA